MSAESPTKTPLNTISLDWKPFGLAFSSPFSQENRLAVTSFEKSTKNYLKIFRIVGPSILLECEIQVKFPQTCCQFCPKGTPTFEDQLVTGGETLQLWKSARSTPQIISDISVNHTRDPITCLDWSQYDDSLVLAGSSDGTATAIDLTTGEMCTRIIAHDHPIHDLSFCGATSTFVTAGFDGSLRFFDLRDLQSSFVYYQTSLPLLRVGISSMESHKIATFAKDSKSVVMIDARNPGTPCAFSPEHGGPITCLGWSKLATDKVYTSDQTGSLKMNMRRSDCFQTELQEWWHFDSCIESFSIGQGIIAVARGNQVDIIEGQKPQIIRHARRRTMPFI